MKKSGTKLFKIQDQDSSQLMMETHYYKWLLSRKPSDIHSIKTKMEYLGEQGFCVGKNHLSTDDLKRLQYIEQHYFNNEIKQYLK